MAANTPGNFRGWVEDRGQMSPGSLNSENSIITDDGTSWNIKLGTVNGKEMSAPLFKRNSSRVFWKYFTYYWFEPLVGTIALCVCLSITASHPPVFPLCTLAHFGRCGRPLATNPPVWGRAEREERERSSGPAPAAPAAHLTSPPRHHSTAHIVRVRAIHWTHSGHRLSGPRPPVSVHTLATLTPGCGRAEVSSGRVYSLTITHITGGIQAGRDWMQWSRPPRHIHEHSGEMLDICPEYKRLQPSVTVA